MTDEELLRLFRETVADEKTALEDSFVDAFLQSSWSCGDSQSRETRSRFVTKLLSSMHQVPVREVARQWTLGRWIEGIREGAGLTRSDVADVIGTDAETVRRLEQGELAPWKLQVPQGAALVTVFRIHLDTLRELLVRSDAVAQRSLGAVAARATFRRGHEARAETVHKALHLYLAAQTSSSVLGRDAEDWLQTVRAHVVRNGPEELIL